MDFYEELEKREMTEEQYDEAVKAMPENIPWQSLPLYELEDTTSGSQELACTAGDCDVVDLVSV